MTEQITALRHDLRIFARAVVFLALIVAAALTVLFIKVDALAEQPTARTTAAHHHPADATRREALFLHRRLTLPSPRPTPTAASRGEERGPVPVISPPTPATPDPAPAGFDAWLHSAMSRQVRECESGMDYGIVDINDGVAYMGAWQANEDFWRTYGGDPAYLGPAPFTAPREMQDRVAYRGYLARGWQPWACA